jgi:hypothetical protein
MGNSGKNIFARCGNCCRKKFWKAKNANDIPQGFPCFQCGAWNDVELPPNHLLKKPNTIELTVLKTVEGYLYEDT